MPNYLTLFIMILFLLLPHLIDYNLINLFALFYLLFSRIVSLSLLTSNSNYSYPNVPSTKDFTLIRSLFKYFFHIFLQIVRHIYCPKNRLSFGSAVKFIILNHQFFFASPPHLSRPVFRLSALTADIKDRK